MITAHLNRISRLLKLIRLQPFDCSTEEGRSNERYRRASLSALASITAKFISMFTILITIPLTMNYLGVERYGMWMTISAIIAVMVSADLGIGNGLLNIVSSARGRNDKEDIIHSVSSAFFMLFTIAIILGFIFALIYRYIPWAEVFNVSSIRAISEAGPTMAVFIGCFLASLPLGIIERIQSGYQEGYYSSLWNAIGSLLGLFAIILIIHFHAGLPWLVLAVSGSQVMAQLFNGSQLLIRRPYLIPSIKKAGYKTAIQIIRIGIWFFLLQIGLAIASASDNLIAAQLISAEAVTQYSVPAKMYSLITVLLSMLIMPLWPAYSEAVARNDTIWVKKTLKSMLKLTLVITGGSAFLLTVFGERIIHLWTGPQITPSFSLLVGLGIWTVVLGCGNTLATFLAAMNRMRFLAIFAIIMAGMSILMKIIMVPSLGVAGVIWGMVCAYSIFYLWPCAYLTKKVLSALNKGVILQ